MKKKFYAFLGVALCAFYAFAASAPFLPEVEARFKAIETTIAKMLPVDEDGTSGMGVVRATWDFDDDGGATGSINLGQTLPANAIVYAVSVLISETPAWTGAGGSIAFGCGSGGDQLAADVDYAAEQPGYLNIGQNNTTNPGLGGCEIHMEIGTDSLTAGRLQIWVQYFKGDEIVN